VVKFCHLKKPAYIFKACSKLRLRKKALRIADFKAEVKLPRGGPFLQGEEEEEAVTITGRRYQGDLPF
jgi:hypothetical protein